MLTGVTSRSAIASTAKVMRLKALGAAESKLIDTLEGYGIPTVLDAQRRTRALPADHVQLVPGVVRQEGDATALLRDHGAHRRGVEDLG